MTVSELEKAAQKDAETYLKNLRKYNEYTDFEISMYQMFFSQHMKNIIEEHKDD